MSLFHLSVKGVFFLFHNNRDIRKRQEGALRISTKMIKRKHHLYLVLRTLYVYDNME